MGVWGRKYPKLLDEEMRHHWTGLEEEIWKHAAARGWKEERFLSRRTTQHVPSCLTSLLCVLSPIDLDLQLLGQSPGRPLRILSTGFIFLPALSLAFATW